MHASELKRNITTRHCIFAIDDAGYIEMLPTATKVGSGDLIKSTTCCLGSMAICLDGTTYMLNEDDRWVEYTNKSGGGSGGGGVTPEEIAEAVSDYMEEHPIENVIDDTAGDGDTDKTWSADKILREIVDPEDIAEAVSDYMEEHPVASEIDDSAGIGDTDKTWSADKILKEATVPHNYAFDGVDLKTVFADADALYNAYSSEDYSKIRVGDYWPVTLNGTYRDYGTMTVPAGVSYYTDTSLSTLAGTTESSYDVTPEQDTNVPGGHKDYCSFKIGSTTYYVAWSNCVEYKERTLSNAVMLFEVCDINAYWRYGDAGANSFQNGKPHLVMQSRDGLPHTLKMRKLNELWENTHIDTFTGDGTTREFTLSGTVGTIGYVYVGGTKKTYSTHYTYGSNKVTFVQAQTPANGAEIKIEWMDAKTPWTGSTLYRTFNDPNYGIIKLIRTADPKLYNHIYMGPNGAGMRYYGETRMKTGAQGGTWEDRGILFLPTEDEVWGRLLYGTSTTYAVNQQQWAIYRGGRRHFAKGAGNGASRAGVWVGSSYSATNFAIVGYNGLPNSNNAESAFVSAPGFLLA